MKKIKNTIIVFFVILICFVLIIVKQKEKSKYENYNEKIMNTIRENNESTMYYVFDNGKKMLIGYNIGSYLDSSKSKLIINNVEYKNNNIIIDIDVDEVRI